MQVNYEFSKGVHMRIEGTVRNGQDNMTRNTQTKRIHKTSTALERSVRKLLEGLNKTESEEMVKTHLPSFPTNSDSVHLLHMFLVPEQEIQTSEVFSLGV